MLATLAALVACESSALGWPGVETEEEQRARELAAYKRAHSAALGRRFVEQADLEAFATRAAGVRVLWLGDHHVDVALHDAQREWLAALRARGLRLALVLEALGEEDDAALAEYVAGRLDEDDLRRNVRERWPGSWLEPVEVDARGYRALLSDARAAHEPVFGLEPAPRLPLAQRDRHIAARVATLAHAHEDRLIVVVVGQAHLLGEGDVVARSGVTGLVVAPALNARLRSARDGLRVQPAARFLVSEAGIWFPVELR